MTKRILSEIKRKLSKTDSPKDLETLWHNYLGKKGRIKELLGGLSKLPEKERRKKGPMIQRLQVEVTNLFKKQELKIKEKENKRKLEEEKEVLDYTIPKIGHLHPLTETTRELNSVFLSMGYSIMDGPEIETDEYCLKRLNVPDDHPARDMQDTIYIEQPDILLRTQTSSIEARLLQNYKPPFKVVSPGRVYRNEKVNRSNHFMFHQYQGVVVLPEASLKDLFGTFTAVFKKMYGEKVVVRYRNKYYPEVEPGVGPDMQCFSCKGKGCPICKGVGWIEMGGAGIIHPNVLKMAGIDPKKWKGFAFGLGLDRWAMAKYNIKDIRTLLGGSLAYKYYENESTL